MLEQVKNWRAFLLAPVNIAPLVFVRIVFGAIMCWEVCRYFNYDWISKYYIKPDFLLKYLGFGWVHPIPGQGMYYLFVLLGLAALFMMVGLWYRWATIFFFFGFTYIFLLDATRYLNHFYLISLVSFLLMFIPANRAVSLDARLKPSIRTPFAPRWALWIIRFQIGVAYFFGGVAKLSYDWIHGEPIRTWIAGKKDFPIIGQFFDQEWMVYFFVFGGILLDLLLVPLLIWRKTRLWMFLAAVLFHLVNAQLFRIGIFPWFMMVITLIFFPPEVPEKILHFFGLRVMAKPEMTKVHHSKANKRYKQPKVMGVNTDPEADVTPRWMLGLMAFFVVFQVLMPLRHLLYPGNVNWTEEGHRLSWHMKLRDKEGRLALKVQTRDTTWYIAPKVFLRKHQRKVVAGHPDLIVQLAHHVGQQFRERGHTNIAVFALTDVQLNFRKSQLLLDSTINLLQVKPGLAPAPFIMPLKEPLPGRKNLTNSGQAYGVAD
jgi:vitamin K-dependent gamma-carboxylase